MFVISLLVFLMVKECVLTLLMLQLFSTACMQWLLGFSGRSKYLSRLQPRITIEIIPHKRSPARHLLEKMNKRTSWTCNIKERQRQIGWKTETTMMGIDGKDITQPFKEYACNIGNRNSEIMSAQW